MISRVRTLLEIPGRFMARVWLTVLYATAMLPFGIVARIRAAPKQRVPLDWRAREESTPDVAKAQRQF